jgi:nucleoside-diphosphate-sugar epimerase
MDILLTGSNGFLGKNIFDVLKEDNFFTTLSRSTSDYEVCLDTTVPDFQSTFEMVIHSAGKAHSIPKTEMEKQEFYDVNVKGTQNLLKGLEIAGLPQQFVFISSVSVYGLDSGKLIKEEDPLLAKDPYGLSKIAAEKLISDWCIQNKVVCTILRLPLMVGENPPGNLGAMLKAIEKRYYFNIGGGNAKKSMVLAKDVAEFIPVVAPMGGVYNLSDGIHPDFKSLSTAICFSLHKKEPLNLPFFIAKTIAFVGDFLGSKAPINSLKLKKITSDLTFDDSKARKVLNWNPRSVTDFISKNSI